MPLHAGKDKTCLYKGVLCISQSHHSVKQADACHREWLMLALQADTADISKLEESIQKWQRSALKAKRHADACYAEAQAKEEEATEAAAQVLPFTIICLLLQGIVRICTGQDTTFSSCLHCAALWRAPRKQKSTVLLAFV